MIAARIAAGSIALASAATAAAPGGRIAFRLFPSPGTLSGEIWVANADGTGRHRVAARRGEDRADPSWSPDGSRLVYSIDHEPGIGEWVDLELVNADGTGRRRLTGGSRTSGESSPAWAPDGRRIAFARSTGLYADGISTVRPDGRGRVAVTYGCDRDPAWSPDSRRIVFARCGGGLWVVSADGSGLHSLTTPPPDDASFEYSDIQPAWSPDGRSIAFVLDGAYTGRGGGDRTTIRIVGADGRGERRLGRGGSGGDAEPTWSPDGTAIAFTRGDDAIWTMRADGTHARRLLASGAGLLDAPAWGR